MTKTKQNKKTVVSGMLTVQGREGGSCLSCNLKNSVAAPGPFLSFIVGLDAHVLLSFGEKQQQSPRGNILCPTEMRSED